MDVVRGLILPSKLNEELAEDIGFMIGDGHIGIYIRSKRSADYVIMGSGHASDDKEYISKHIRGLKRKLYGLRFPVSYQGNTKSEIRLKLNCKSLLHFYRDVIGLPMNKKEEIGIPKIIWKDKK